VALTRWPTLCRPRLQVSFDDFICCSVRLRAYSEAFKARDVMKQGFAQLHYDDFIQMTMRL
jgi:hypothetical protein